MIVLRRLGEGIASHFHVRAGEWIMVPASIVMGLGLTYQEDMFGLSPSFSALSSLMPQSAWASLILFAAVLRLLALIVNGTFSGFRWAPHMRAGAAMVNLIFWMQFGIGFLSSFLYGGGAITGAITYLLIVTPFEAANFVRALHDIQPRRR